VSKISTISYDNSETVRMSSLIGVAFALSIDIDLDNLEWPWVA